MKYKVIVEKISSHKYLAFCPHTHSLRASGDDVSEALENLQQGLLCYLHDPWAELDITVKDPSSINRLRRQFSRRNGIDLKYLNFVYLPKREMYD